MLSISGFQLHQILDFKSLIPALKVGLRKDISVPKRHHHTFHRDSTLLLMPAWVDGEYLGVKLITVLPHNRQIGLPSIRGTYSLFNAETGEAIAQIDAPVLTNFRTAAASALAASYLAPVNAERLLMVGTGSLAPFLIRAHLAVRSYREVLVWGRNYDKAESLVQSFEGELNITPVTDLADAAQSADVITVATMARNPIIKGEMLRPGTHLDLVGSYLPDMREADDDAISRAKIYIDTPDGLQESGDLMQPMQNKVIEMGNIAGTLSGLVSESVPGRTEASDITLYKSVGHASQDLITAIFAYENYGTHF